MKKGVLLVNLGTPKSPTAADVRTYLSKFLADKRVLDVPRAIWLPILHGMILRTRPKRSAARYRQIWTKAGSPLFIYAQKQAQQLQALLPTTIVKYAFCYSDPSITDSLTEMQQAGVTDLTIIPLYPQYSVTTVASVYDQVATHFMHAQAMPNLHFVTAYYQHPTYIKALAAQIKQALAQQSYDRIIFSYHGIPEKYVTAGDPYFKQCTATTQQVMALVGDVPYTQTFQSKFGPGKWLSPATDDTLRALPQQNVKSVLVLTPGFVADCLETLEEIDQENRGYFKASGGQQFTYLHPFNESQTFTQLLADLA